MNDQVDRRVAGALRAQAAGAAPPAPSGHEPAQTTGRGLPGWAVLAVAVLLGTTAGALAGVISVW
ncbi:MAG: hypothetical protein ACRDRP_13805 [Pseudonocardiaceae bacterium]